MCLTLDILPPMEILISVPPQRFHNQPTPPSKWRFMLSLLSLVPWEDNQTMLTFTFSEDRRSSHTSHKDHFHENAPGPKWSSPDKPLLHILPDRPTNFRIVPRQHRQLLSFLLKVANDNVNVNNINIISITFNINKTNITSLTITLLKIKHQHRHYWHHLSQYQSISPISARSTTINNNITTTNITQGCRDSPTCWRWKCCWHLATLALPPPGESKI